VIALKPIGSGLVAPLTARHARDGSGRLFIVELPGRIRVYDGTTILPAPFLDITNRVMSGGGSESGLLGLDFHPDYPSNGIFYVCYSRATDGQLTISRFSVTVDPDVADPGSEVEILTIPKISGLHNGGDIHFGPDGYLYVGTGDDAWLDGPQDLDSLTGKMLRIEVDPSGTYTIPPDNPFVGVAGLDEIWAYGLRNPWRWSFDRSTGDLIIGDVGDSAREEIDLQSAASAGGENYGWPCFEGDLPYDPTRPGCNGPYAFPTLVYDHTQGCSVTGGYRYRGSRLPVQDAYVYGDYCTGEIWVATDDGAGNWSSELAADTTERIIGFGEDEAGELYVLGYFGNIHKLESNLDFGDAPDPSYPTLKANNGASHVIGSLYMGGGVDGDPDGQPHPAAAGDNLNGNDETGVSFLTPNLPGAASNLTIWSSGNGLLDAWIDFDQDGDWSDPDDQIFASVPLVPGLNPLSFAVPSAAIVGSTLARFRISSGGGLSFAGGAPDGEVEDYRVDIAPEVSVGDVTLPEGDAGTTFALFEVTLSAPSTSKLFVGCSAVDDTAVAPSDYLNQVCGVTFLPGETSKVFGVRVVGDRIAETDESFFANLSPSLSYSLADGQGIGTILNDDVPGTIGFSSASYLATESGGVALITVERSGGTAGGVTVDYATSDGTASAGSDYTATAGTLSFDVDVVSQTFAVPITNDTLDDDTETVLLTLSNPTAGAVLGLSNATLTIEDDDVAGLLAFSLASYSVGEAGKNATITVTRSGGAASGVTVAYAASDGSAIAGSDYTAPSGTLTFAANVSKLSFTVPVSNDTLAEGTETVLLELSAPGGGGSLGAPSTALLTITDNDSGGAFRFGKAAYTVSEGLASVKVTVTRPGGIASGVAVDYTSLDGTAQEPDDYSAVSGTLTFAAGQASQTITIPIVEDALDEANETVELALSNPTGGATLGSPAAATLTINDNDSGGVLQFALAAVSADEGAGTALVIVKRTGGSAEGVSVTCTPADGTAIGGADHNGAVQVLNFGAGVMSQSCSIPILEDALAEGAETLSLTLSDPAGAASLGSRSTSSLTITDNEPVTTLHFASQLFTVKEGGLGVVTVNRSGPVSDPVTVEFATSDGTALISDSDYAAASGMLSFPANVTSLTFLVSTTSDTRDESDEDVNLMLSNPTGGAVLGTQATAKLLIADNDSGGVFRLGKAAYTAGEGLAVLKATVVRSGGIASGATVDYTSSDGTAHAPDDYSAVSGTLTFAAGQVSQTVIVPIVNDALEEAKETLTLTLTNPTGGATLGSPGASTLTIADNDSGGVLQFALAGVSIDEGAGTAQVVVSRTGGAADGVSVTCTPVDGTATSGADHNGAVQVLTFGAGVTSQSCDILILEDALGEGPETLSLTLSDPTGGATLGSRQVSTLTITDNEPVTTLHFASPVFTVKEGGTGIVTVKRSGPAADPVTVDFATSDGTALLSDSDYAAVTGTLSFGANVTSLTFLVPTTPDTRDESDEDVNLTLSNPIGGAVLGTQATAKLLITDNDSGGGLHFSLAAYSRSEAGGAATITVTRAGGVASGITVDYASSDGTAQAPGDYAAATGTLSFAAGQKSRSFSLAILQDLLDEPAETIQLTLSNPTGGATIDAPGAVVTITDDDVAGTLALGSALYSVGESGATATITVIRTGGTADGVTVEYAIADGTATAGADYQPVSGTLTFGPGNASVTFTVPILADALLEPNETILVTLASPGGGGVLGSPSAATLYIVDDD
jgi:glucose/arabinose dehydrogenase